MVHPQNHVFFLDIRILVQDIMTEHQCVLNGEFVDTFYCTADLLIGFNLCYTKYGNFYKIFTFFSTSL